jgi:hypothetical protein
VSLNLAFNRWSLHSRPASDSSGEQTSPGDSSTPLEQLCLCASRCFLFDSGGHLAQVGDLDSIRALCQPEGWIACGAWMLNRFRGAGKL